MNKPQRLSDDDQTGLTLLKFHTKIDWQPATRKPLKRFESNLLIITKGPLSLALSPTDVVLRWFPDDLKVQGLSVVQKYAAHAWHML